MQESSDQAAMDALSQEFKLTTREGEVLYWVVKGKTNRDIGDILGSSPATVKKQLEHIFAKLGVETRTAAAGLAMSRVAALKMRSRIREADALCDPQGLGAFTVFEFRQDQ